MKVSSIFLIVVLLIGVSCANKVDTESVTSSTDSLALDATRIVSALPETLIPKAKMELSNWKEYKNVDEIMLKYYNISYTQALLNAKELADMVTSMRDSIRVDEIDKPNVIVRINVLENEALRLADMANIPSITSDEVKNQVQKIIELFSAFNSKINTIYKASDLQKSLEVDTEKPDSLQINLKRLEPKNIRNVISTEHT